MFKIITDWIIAHKDDIITAIIIESIFASIVMSFRYVKKNTPKAIKRLKKIKGIKYLGFILLYALPLGTIIWMTIDRTNEPTFKNIALFIIICVSFIYNLLINHIISLYKMNTRLTNISSDKLTKIDQTFDKVYHHIEKIKTDNNLK